MSKIKYYVKLRKDQARKFVDEKVARLDINLYFGEVIMNTAHNFTVLKLLLLFQEVVLPTLMFSMYRFKAQRMYCNVLTRKEFAKIW